MINLLKKTFLSKLIKFCFVGFSGMIIDFGLTFLCKEKIRMNKYVSNAIGFLSAATSNYYLNRIWTFHSLNPAIAVEYSKFIFFSIIGLGLNTLIIWLLIKKLDMNFYVSKLFAIFVVTFWNFFINLAYTFVSA